MVSANIDADIDASEVVNFGGEDVDDMNVGDEEPPMELGCSLFLVLVESLTSVEVVGRFFDY